MLTTKSNARALAQANSDRDKIIRAVIRRKSKFAAVTLESAKVNGFTIIETIRPAEKAGCDCREKVNAKVDGGELRNALNRSHAITSKGEDSLVRQACDRRALRGRFVDSGEVRSALSYAGWSQNEIDFLLYRSLHEHEAE